MTGSILKIALMKESLSVRSPNISARILPRSQKKYGATGSSIHGTAAVLQTPIIFANTATIARRQMPVESLLFVIPNVDPAINATMSAAVLNGNIATGSSRPLLFAMAEKKQGTNAPYKPNMIITPKLPRGFTKNSVHPPEPALT